MAVEHFHLHLFVAILWLCCYYSTYRLGICADALRIEKLLCVSKECRNPIGCPIAKWVGELHYCCLYVTVFFWHYVLWFCGACYLSTLNFTASVCCVQST